MSSQFDVQPSKVKSRIKKTPDDKKHNCISTTMISPREKKDPTWDVDLMEASFPCEPCDFPPFWNDNGPGALKTEWRSGVGHPRWIQHLRPGLQTRFKFRKKKEPAKSQLSLLQNVAPPPRCYF